jgi:glycosyltransferase involved in cell wall biosynthesis
MHSKLDVETNKDIKFEDNFYVKYYDETKVDKFSLQLFLNVWKDIKSSDIAHIQAIFNTPVPVSLFYAKLFKKPIILSPRGSLGEWCIGNGSRFKNIWLNYLLKPLVQNITWHATAEQEKDEILSIYPNAKVSIIPNGIEYDKLIGFLKSFA